MLLHFRIFFFTKCKRCIRKHLKNTYKGCSCFYYLTTAQQPPLKKTSTHRERGLNSSPRYAPSGLQCCKRSLLWGQLHSSHYFKGMDSALSVYHC